VPVEICVETEIEPEPELKKEDVRESETEIVTVTVPVTEIEMSHIETEIVSEAEVQVKQKKAQKPLQSSRKEPSVRNILMRKGENLILLQCNTNFPFQIVQLERGEGHQVLYSKTIQSEQLVRAVFNLE
jgi:hypothetical protein